MSDRLIPVDKINDQRFGQLIYNALRPESGFPRDVALADRLFDISNEELEQALQAFIAGPKGEE